MPPMLMISHSALLGAFSFCFKGKELPEISGVANW